MAEKPTTLPQWATDGGATLEPAAGVKGTGFVVGTRPPARWMNWILNTTYQWMQYLDAPVGTGSGAGISATGGSTDGTGLVGTGGATDGIGVQGYGAGDGAGIEGSGSGSAVATAATAGTGVVGRGGLTDAPGGEFFANGVGSGVRAFGGTGVLGGYGIEAYGGDGLAGGVAGYFVGGTGSIFANGSAIIASVGGGADCIVATAAGAYAGKFTSAGTSAALYAENTTVGSAIYATANVAIRGYSNSSLACIEGTNAASGSGSYGESSSGRGVWGKSATGVGVRGEVTTSGNGVEGVSIAGYGVHGVSPGGFGVRGESTSSTGVDAASTNGTGVYGYSVNGIAGQFRADNNHAVVAEGDVFSPVKSSFYINQQDADPSSSAAGSVYLHGSAGQMSIKTNHNVWARVQNKLYSMTSDTDTITNSGTFASAFVIPGSTLRVGSTIRIRASAIQFGGNITPAEVNGWIRVFLVSSVSGSVQVGQARVITVGAGSVTDTQFAVDVTVTISATGASGSVRSSSIGITSRQNFNRPEDTFLAGLARTGLNMSGNVTVQVDGYTGTALASLRLVDLVVDTTD